MSPNSKQDILAENIFFEFFCLLMLIYCTIYIDALTVTGDVEEGLPSWQLPWKFNLDTTNSTTSGPIEMAEDFGIGLLMLPLVSMLQHLAIAKFYTRKCLYLIIF